MELGDSMPHLQGLSPTLSRINPFPRIDAYLFKIHSNIVFPSTPSLPKCLFPVDVPVKILKEVLPSSILSSWDKYDIFYLFRYIIPSSRGFTTESNALRHFLLTSYSIVN